MRKVEIKINQEVVDYLQRLHYDVETRQDIIHRIFDAHAYDETTDIIESAIFKRYERELSELKAEYEIAKLNITNDYVPEDLKTKQNSWNMDFATGIMTIEVKDA